MVGKRPGGIKCRYKSFLPRVKAAWQVLQPRQRGQRFSKRVYLKHLKTVPQPRNKQMRASELNLIGMSLTTYLQSLIIVLEHEEVQ